MDPIIIGLGAKVIEKLMPFVTQGAEKLTQAVGETAVKKLENLLTTLKTRFSGDKEMIDNIARFEKKPEIYKAALEDILQEKLDHDNNLAMQLTRQLKEIPVMDFTTVVGDVKAGGKVKTLVVKDAINEGNITARTTAEQVEGEVITAEIGSIGGSLRREMYCIKCNALLDPDARYCNHCGTPVNT